MSDMKVRFYLNFDEDKTISMKLYAAEHIKNLKKYNNEIKVSFFKPKIPKFFNFFSYVWKMRIARYFLYRQQIKNLSRVDIAHVVDQQYAHIINEINAKKKIITVHDLQPVVFEKFHNKNPILFKYSLMHLKKFDYIISVSKKTKKEILKFTKVNKKKIAILYQTTSELLKRKKINKKLIKNFIKYKKKIIIITFSRIFYKNFKTSFKVFQKLQRKYKNLYFLNFGKIPSHFDKKFQNNLIELPYLNNNERNYVFKSADILLFPSLYEGYGRPCMEAMAIGLPVVSSNIPSLKEILGEAGIYCKINDVNSYTSKIEKLIDNKKYYLKIKNKLKKRSKIFNEKKYYHNLISLYKTQLI